MKRNARKQSNRSHVICPGSLLRFGTYGPTRRENARINMGDLKEEKVIPYGAFAAIASCRTVATGWQGR